MLKEFINTEEDAKIALLGTIFADGHIAQKRPTAYINKTYIEITHTSKNLDYLKEVKELFESINGMNCSIKEHNKKTVNKEYTLFRLTTNSVKWLADLREEIYENKVKKFPNKYIDLFTDLSLFLLYLDDGTLKVKFYEGTDRVREARITFCLDSFTFDEMKYFQKYLLDRWNIKTGIYRHSKNMPLNRGYRLWTNSENTRKFMNIIDKYYECVPSMKYKFLKYYLL